MLIDFSVSILALIRATQHVHLSFGNKYMLRSGNLNNFIATIANIYVLLRTSQHHHRTYCGNADFAKDIRTYS